MAHPEVIGVDDQEPGVGRIPREPVYLASLRRCHPSPSSPGPTDTSPYRDQRGDEREKAATVANGPSEAGEAVPELLDRADETAHAE